MRREGWLFMIGLEGPRLSPEEEETIRELGLRHFILFRRNLEDRQQTARLVSSLRRYGGFVAVDQEGGPVARLRPPLFPDLPAPLELAGDPDPEGAVARTAALCARHLREYGFNLNLSPVLDLGDEEAPSFLRGRTFGRDPEKVARLGRTYVETFLSEGLLCCAKHFPGLGEARLDPHEDLPVLERLDPAALEPFRAAVDAGVPCVMTTHLLIRELDQRPATFSSSVVTLLRRELSFPGFVLTDDLFMGAVLKKMDLAEAALHAFLAGHDLLLLCQDFRRSAETIRELLPELRSPALKGRVEESLERQEKLFKYCLPAG